ncbi:MAG: metallophosphoesterase family protein [Anaerolineae bacterium]
MTHLAWMTDIHLNFLGTTQIEDWLQQLKRETFQALLITGDIGEADSLKDYLIRMHGRLGVPIYFVLGNHDYYRSSIANVRANMHHLHDEHPSLIWLPIRGIVQLSERVGLIGHGSWSDGGYGDFMASPIILNDYVLIHDLCDLPRAELLGKLRELGQEAADYIAEILPIALEQYDQMLVALHVPPFQESCWHDGKTPPDEDAYLPHFTCKAVGDVLLQIADANPHKQLTVLCGHTHGTGVNDMRQNLQVITAGAEYGKPKIARIFSL